jgi:hypothetical protein
MWPFEDTREVTARNFFFITTNRVILLKQDGVGKLFKLLNESEPFFATDIIDALASWLA